MYWYSRTLKVQEDSHFFSSECKFLFLISLGSLCWFSEPGGGFHGGFHGVPQGPGHGGFCVGYSQAGHSGGRDFSNQELQVYADYSGQCPDQQAAPTGRLRMDNYRGSDVCSRH